MIPAGLRQLIIERPDQLPTPADAPLLLMPGYLDAMRSAPDITTHLHALLDGQRPVALLCLHQLDLAPSRTITMLAAAPRAARLTRLVGWALHHTNTSAVICGDPFVPGLLPWWRDEALPEAALVGWITGLMAQASARGAALQIFKDLPHDLCADKTHTFQRHHSDPVMLLELDPAWRSIDDYMKILNKKYRQNHQRTLKRTAHIQRRVMAHDEVVRRGDRLWDLHQHVLASASFCPVTYGAHTFAALSRTMGDHYKIYGYFDEEDRLIAFNTQLRDRATLISHFFGMERRDQRPASLYQRILLDDLDDAIRAGAHTLHLGRGATTAKSALGAQPRALPTLIRHPHPIGQLLQRPLARLLAPAPWSPRHPLRTHTP